MFYPHFIDGQQHSNVTNLNSGELGLELKCSNFQTRCSQGKTVTVISPLLNTTDFHSNKITNTYSTEPLVRRFFQLARDVRNLTQVSAEGLGNPPF